MKIPTSPKLCQYGRWIQKICGSTNEIKWECRLTKRPCGVFTKKEPCTLTNEETND